MLCSEWVPSEWESDKNSTPVHQLTSGEDKNWNKSTIKTFLTQIWTHNNICDKVFWSESGEKSAQIKQRVQDKTALSFCLLQMLNDELECCFYQTLILTAPIHCRASIKSHSDGTHSLQSIHYWDTFLQTWWRNKLILIWGCVRFQQGQLVFL